MNILHPEAESIAREYIGTSGSLEELGYGVEGVVYPSLPASTAVKVHTQQEPFDKEIAVYKRLQQCGVIEIQGFAIPKLVNHDPRLRVIEMSIVKPPFLLDFAQIDLDRVPDFSEGLDEWWERVRERCEEKFLVVESVFWELQRRCGIY